MEVYLTFVICALVGVMACAINLSTQKLHLRVMSLIAFSAATGALVGLYFGLSRGGI